MTTTDGERYRYEPEIVFSPGGWRLNGAVIRAFLLPMDEGW